MCVRERVGGGGGREGGERERKMQITSKRVRRNDRERELVFSSTADTGVEGLKKYLSFQC